MKDTPKVALITGASSGIGRAICDLLAANGVCVYGGSRRDILPEHWTHLQLDVTDAGSVRSAVEEVRRREGRLDVVVSCAGVGLAGPFEATADDEAQSHFDVNFFGSARVIRRALQGVPAMAPLFFARNATPSAPPQGSTLDPRTAARPSRGPCA